MASRFAEHKDQHHALGKKDFRSLLAESTMGQNCYCHRRVVGHRWQFACSVRLVDHPPTRIELDSQTVLVADEQTWGIAVLCGYLEMGNSRTASSPLAYVSEMDLGTTSSGCRETFVRSDAKADPKRQAHCPTVGMSPWRPSVIVSRLYSRARRTPKRSGTPEHGGTCEHSGTPEHG